MLYKTNNMKAMKDVDPPMLTKKGRMVMDWNKVKSSLNTNQDYGGTS